MILANFGTFLLAPILASSFIGFGANDGFSFANATNSFNGWGSSAVEWRGGPFGNGWNWNWGGNNNSDNQGDRFGRNPVITRIAPDEGPVGTEVRLSGARFTSDSVVRIGDGAIHDVTVSNNGRTLSFVVPDYVGQYCPPDEFCTAIAYEVTPGDYEIRVVTGPRTSNSVTFTVTAEEEEPGTELAIDSIEGPTSLALGAEGSWTVNVSGATSSDLRYSVTWGDERLGLRSLLSLDEGQASATFTHTYDEPGVYTPEFTVRDADGNTVSKQAAEVTVHEDGAVRIDAIEPASARAGAQVTLTGEGFDGETEVWIGRRAAEQVEIESDSSLSFTVPSLPAGDYRVTVTSDEGRSNAVAFRILEEQIKGRVSVSGVDAPTRLEVDQEGTWTVHAASNLEGNLRYSVDWGESNAGALRSPQSEMTQSSATFTHSYASPGTYYPKFTVTDEEGNKASVSASVIVR